MFRKQTYLHDFINVGSLYTTITRKLVQQRYDAFPCSQSSTTMLTFFFNRTSRLMEDEREEKRSGMDGFLPLEGSWRGSGRGLHWNVAGGLGQRPSAKASLVWLLLHPLQLSRGVKLALHRPSPHTASRGQLVQLRWQGSGLRFGEYRGRVENRGRRHGGKMCDTGTSSSRL